MPSKTLPSCKIVCQNRSGRRSLLSQQFSTFCPDDRQKVDYKIYEICLNFKTFLLLNCLINIVYPNETASNCCTVSNRTASNRTALIREFYSRLFKTFQRTVGWKCWVEQCGINNVEWTMLSQHTLSTEVDWPFERRERLHHWKSSFCRQNLPWQIVASHSDCNRSRSVCFPYRQSGSFTMQVPFNFKLTS